jgi:hypothetical protein
LEKKNKKSFLEKNKKSFSKKETVIFQSKPMEREDLKFFQDLAYFESLEQDKEKAALRMEEEKKKKEFKETREGTSVVLTEKTTEETPKVDPEFVRRKRVEVLSARIAGTSE